MNTRKHECWVCGVYAQTHYVGLVPVGHVLLCEGCIVRWSGRSDIRNFCECHGHRAICFTLHSPVPPPPKSICGHCGALAHARPAYVNIREQSSRLGWVARWTNICLPCWEDAKAYALGGREPNASGFIDTAGLMPHSGWEV